MTARYGPTDSVGSKATGSEKNRLRVAALGAPCEAERCCSTSSSSERSLSHSASGTYACTSPARYRALSCARCSRDSETRETAASNVFMILHVMPGMPASCIAGGVAHCRVRRIVHLLEGWGSRVDIFNVSFTRALSPLA